MEFLLTFHQKVYLPSCLLPFFQSLIVIFCLGISPFGTLGTKLMIKDSHSDYYYEQENAMTQSLNGNLQQSHSSKMRPIPVCNNGLMSISVDRGTLQVINLTDMKFASPWGS